MKNGWFKVDFRDRENVDDFPIDREVVYVENDIITKMAGEWGCQKENVNIVLTDELKKYMVAIEFEKVGVA